MQRGDDDGRVAEDRLEHAGDPPTDDLERAGGEHVVAILHRRVDLAAADAGEGAMAEGRVGMDPEGRLGLGGVRRPGDLAGPPLLGALPEHDLAVCPIDVDASGEVGPNPVDEPLGISLATERSDLLGTAANVPPPGPVATMGAPTDARHRTRRPS